MTPNDKLYGLEHQEHLDSDIESVIERVLSDVGIDFESVDAAVPQIKFPIRVHVYRRIAPTKMADAIARRSLDDALEFLDEELCDPSCDDPTEPTDDMKKAAAEFARVVTSKYVSWACEPTGEIILVTRENLASFL